MNIFAKLVNSIFFNVTNFSYNNTNDMLVCSMNGINMFVKLDYIFTKLGWKVFFVF